jgi:hypothetical protein
MNKDLRLCDYEVHCFFQYYPFQERGVSECAELIYSVFEENVNELELEVINLQTDLPLKTRANDTDVWNLASCA